jgi:transcriptional antiterminator RfaH
MTRAGIAATVLAMQESTDENQDLLVVPGADSNWIVVHTRPRCEKKLEDHCRREHIGVFLPLRRKTHKYGARSRTFDSPLFSGYAFCVANKEQRSHLRQNRYVANVLDVVDQAPFVQQLRQIRLALETGNMVEVIPYMEAGNRVRVTQGPLKGMEGIVQRVKSRTRVVISVDMIQQSMAVDVDSWMIQPA